MASCVLSSRDHSATHFMNATSSIKGGLLLLLPLFVLATELKGSAILDPIEGHIAAEGPFGTTGTSTDDFVTQFDVLVPQRVDAEIQIKNGVHFDSITRSHAVFRLNTY